MNKIIDESGSTSSSRRPLPRRGQIKSKIAANALNSIVSALSRAAATHPNLKPYSRSQFLKMMNKIGDFISEAAVRESYSSRKPLPKRGQIKSKIAVNAVNSIVSALSRASSRQYRSNPYSREIKSLRNH